MSSSKQPDTEQHSVVISTGEGMKVVPVQSKDGKHTHVRILHDPDDVLREQASGFTNFLREYAVVGLAIGFILGQQANVVVKQLVDSFVVPVLSLFFGGDLSKQSFVLAYQYDSPIEVAWGRFVYVFIEFLFVAVVIYAVVKLLRLDRLKKPKDGNKK